MWVAMRAKSEYGEVRVEDQKGTVDANTGSGVVTLARRDSEARAHTGSGKGTSAGAGGKTGGAGAASQFGWYGNMLHDRFYSEWIQPTTVTPSGEKISVLVKLRIEQDGRVSEFEVVKPSGNVAVDESVAAVARRIAQVDPLPEGLGSGGRYRVRIYFGINRGQ